MITIKDVLLELYKRILRRHMGISDYEPKTDAFIVLTSALLNQKIADLNPIINMTDKKRLTNPIFYIEMLCALKMFIYIYHTQKDYKMEEYFKNAVDMIVDNDAK